MPQTDPGRRRGPRRLLPALRLAVALPALLAAATIRPATASSPPSMELRGIPVARVSVSLVPRDGGVRVPGPFTVLPGGRRVAIDLPEANGILLLEGERIVHYFDLPGDASVWDDMAASPTLLTVGRRIRGGSVYVDLIVFDLRSGKSVQRVQSSNPYLQPPETGRDDWRIVLDGGHLGVFEPRMAATYPLWDRKAGVIAGGEQVVQSISGVGFDADARWIPAPDGSVNRKVRGHSEPFAAPGAGEFLGGLGDSAVVLLADDGADGPRLLPRELVVRVQDELTIRELRLPAVDEAVVEERRVLSGRPALLSGGRLFWCYLGPDYLEIRSAAIPAAGS